MNSFINDIFEKIGAETAVRCSLHQSPGHCVGDRFAFSHIHDAHHDCPELMPKVCGRGPALISCVPLYDAIAIERQALARYNKKPTVTSREIQTSVRLILPGELAKHAVSEARYFCVAPS